MRSFGLRLLRSILAPQATPWDVIVLLGMAFAFGSGRTVTGGAALLLWLAGSMGLGAILDRADRRAGRILPLETNRKGR